MSTTTLERPETPTTTVADEAIEDFMQVRRRLLAVARRIVGSDAEAEDIVQEAWLRWQLCDRDVVVSPAAFLVTTTTRLAINARQSARVRRETSVGEWVVEPTAHVDDPTAVVERRETLGVGLGMLNERLAPVERTAFVLRHAFDHPYSRIAEALDLSEANARQVVSRAGRRLRSAPAI